MPVAYRFEIWEMTRDESALLDSMIDDRQYDYKRCDYPQVNHTTLHIYNPIQLSDPLKLMLQVCNRHNWTFNIDLVDNERIKPHKFKYESNLMVTN